jgi:hypothetical protein
MIWLLPTIATSIMVAQVVGCAQGQMSQWACGKRELGVAPGSQKCLRPVSGAPWYGLALDVRYRQRVGSILSLSRGGILIMATANGDRKSLLFNLRVPKLSNVVVRDVRDRDGRKLGRIVQTYDGTETA